MEKKKKLTSNAGAPVPDNQNVMTAEPLRAWDSARYMLVGQSKPERKGGQR